MKLPEWWNSDKPYKITDWVDGLIELPGGVIDCVVTSPPYWALRDYGCDGQVGLEDSYDDYIKVMCDGFDEVKRVLKDSGTCWVNLGDTYGGPTGQPNAPKLNPQQVDEHKSASECKKTLQAKSLVMIPFRFAIEMVNRGWILRNTIIWHKNNCMPSSVKDRFTVDYEYMFFFTKKKKYYFEQQFEEFSESYLKDGRPAGVLRQRLYEDSKYKKFSYGNEQFKGKATIEPEERFRKQDNVPSKNANTYKGFNDRWREKHRPYAVMDPKDRAEIVEYREYPPHDEIREFLREWKDNLGLTIEEIENMFGTQAPHHWFENNGTYPTVADWKRLISITENLLQEWDPRYDDAMLTVYTKSGEKQNYPQGRNKRCVWTINPQPYSEAHFAVYPPELIETPIVAGCPEFVCNKCGKPREKILEVVGERKAQNGPRTPQESENTGRRDMRTFNVYGQTGWSDCGCNAGFSPGVVLDPFLGSGTTIYVARQKHRIGLGFELNPDYEDMIIKRADLHQKDLEDFL